MKSKLLLFITIISFFLIGCDKRLKNDVDFINQLSSNVDFELPLISEPIIIFLQTDNKLYITSLRNLYNEYIENYKSQYSFDEFLVEVINKNRLSKEQVVKVSDFNYNINKQIASLYDNNELDYFIKTYCRKGKYKDQLYLTNDVDVEMQFNIMYYFFKNNYYLVEDDYEGYYVLINKN